MIVSLHLYLPVIGVTRPDRKIPGSNLAEHLTRSDVKFYGASWCPHCQEQKHIWQLSESIPYIECSPGGPSPQAADKKGNSGYPTWIVGDRRPQRVTADTLAQLSKFDWGSHNARAVVEKLFIFALVILLGPWELEQLPTPSVEVPGFASKLCGLSRRSLSTSAIDRTGKGRQQALIIDVRTDEVQEAHI